MAGSDTLRNDLARLVDRLPVPAVNAADTTPFDLDAWANRIKAEDSISTNKTSR